MATIAKTKSKAVTKPAVSDSPTSYTMSLARGIRLRGLRELSNHPIDHYRVYERLVQCHMQRRKLNKTEKYFGDLQRRHQIKGYLFASPNAKNSGQVFLCAYPVDSGFEFVAFIWEKKSVDVGLIPIRLTNHAIERIIYRLELPDLKSAIREIVSALSDLAPVSLAIEESIVEEDDVYVRTKNGFATMSPDVYSKGDDRKAAIVTWCTDKQEFEDQGTIRSTAEFIRDRARDNNMSPLDLVSKLWGCDEKAARSLYSGMVLHAAMTEFANKPLHFDNLLN